MMAEKIPPALVPFYVRAINGILIVSLALMVVLVFGNVVLRYAFNSGIAVSEEISRLLFVWLTFLGAIVAMYEKAHLGVDTLISKLGTKGKRICWLASQLLMFICCVVIAWGGARVTQINAGSEAAVSGFSNAWIYVSVVVAALGIGLIIIANLWKMATGQLSDTDLLIVSESEEKVVLKGNEGSR